MVKSAEQGPMAPSMTGTVLGSTGEAWARVARRMADKRRVWDLDRGIWNKITLPANWSGLDCEILWRGCRASLDWTAGGGRPYMSVFSCPPVPVVWLQTVDR